MSITIIQGDSLNQLKYLQDESIDFLCTDPPYGYNFMGKDWDKAVPSVDIWRECLRVLKSGAFCCVMSAPRSDVQCAMVSRLQEAGFRLDFTPIYWTYASGFPKAGDTAKLIDRRLGVEPNVIGIQKLQGTARRMKGGNYGDFGGEDTADSINLTDPTSEQAKAMKGSKVGFQPKPAVEVIIVAMKPLSEKTYVDQALANGHGVAWLDDARIPFEQNFEAKVRNNKQIYGRTSYLSSKTQGFPGGNTENPQGRFPANLLVSDDILNDGRTIKSGGSVSGDEPSSVTDNSYGQYAGRVPYQSPNDSGSYSRYFDLDKWAQTLPFLIVPKASKSEKNKGLGHLQDKQSAGLPMRSTNGDSLGTGADGTKTDRTVVVKNHHPTVKPVKLMSYLITLFSRPGDMVLDPFVGSGTTAVAADMLERSCVGIELEKEYVDICNGRLASIEMKQAKLL